jgi:uncharacterized protein YkwD
MHSPSQREIAWLPTLRGGMIVLAFALASSPGLAAAASYPQFVANTPVEQQPTIDNEAWAFLPLINEYRAQNGLGKLELSGTLTQSALWMSSDMAKNSYFSHTDSQGRSLSARLASFGYGGTYGENIAAGQASAQDVFKAWEQSPGHQANMLSPNYKAIGIARVVNPNSVYKTYWTTDFGAQVDNVIVQDSDRQSANPMQLQQNEGTQRENTETQFVFPAMDGYNSAQPVNYFGFPEQTTLTNNYVAQQPIEANYIAQQPTPANNTYQNQPPQWQTWCASLMSRLKQF